MTSLSLFIILKLVTVFASFLLRLREIFHMEVSSCKYTLKLLRGYKAPVGIIIIMVSRTISSIWSAL